MGLSCSLLKKNSDVYIKIWEADIYDQKICSTRHISARLQPASCLAAAGQAGGSGLFECSLHHALLPYSLKPSSVYLFGLCINSLYLAIGQLWKFYKGRLYWMSILLFQGTQKFSVDRDPAYISFLSCLELGNFPLDESSNFCQIDKENE